MLKRPNVAELAKLIALKERLEGQVIREVKINKNESKHEIEIVCENGSTFVVAVRSGRGADGGWHTWTEVTINGYKIIDE